MIFQLAYVSKNHMSEEEIEAEVYEILETSCDNNYINGLTGVLIFRHGVFLQLLEGTREAVLNTFGKIASDNRHYEVTTLFSRFSPERVFNNWSMSAFDLRGKKPSDDAYCHVVQKYLANQTIFPDDIHVEKMIKEFALIKDKVQKKSA